MGIGQFNPNDFGRDRSRHGNALPAERVPGLARGMAAPLVIIAAGVLMLLPSLVGCGSSASTSVDETDVAETSDEGDSPVAIIGLKGSPPDAVRLFCEACHRLPDPDYFPKAAWYEEVERGFRFYFESGRSDLELPGLDETVRYYRHHAPDRLEMPTVPPVDQAWRDRFRREAFEPLPEELVDASGDTVHPAIASLRWVDPADRQSGRLLFADMRSGIVGEVSFDERRPRGRRLARLDHPCHVEPVPSPDGVGTDLVAADLGSFRPADHADGRVVMLREGADGQYEPEVVLDGLGRVADVRPGDFDGDGDVDLVVAEFGWQTTGGIHLLINESQPGSLSYVDHLLDSRAGTIHVPVLDLDNDGALDFVALVSQHHEVIEVFLNRDGGRFDREALLPPADPSYGSSGIEPVDLDGDGDLDLLYTNGDTFDSYYAKPYHGLAWLENRGDGSFDSHRLVEMPGIHRALPADFDGDGDLDIACVALLPGQLQALENRTEFAAVAILENLGERRFEQRVLETSNCNHPCCAVGDFDGDGDMDLVVGNHIDVDDSRRESLVFWWNRADETP